LFIKTPMVDASHYVKFVEKVEALFKKTFGSHIEFTTTGMLTLSSRIVVGIQASMVRSYTIVFIVISILMILFLGELRLGLASMVPNLFPIVLCLGIMGWFGIPLDNFTMLIGSIAIGLAVDDTIHFMYGFRRYYRITGDPREAVRRTITTSGRAMLFTSLVLSTGFFIYMFATLNNMILFGLLTGIAIIIALLADFIIAPALAVMLTKNGLP
jgi:predicted RND superfamily exporter protein